MALQTQHQLLTMLEALYHSAEGGFDAFLTICTMIKNTKDDTS